MESKTKSFKTDYRKMSKTLCEIMAGKENVRTRNVNSEESWKATKLQTKRKTIKNQQKNKTKNTKAFSCTLYVPDIFKH